jgi:hypothetical protein
MRPYLKNTHHKKRLVSKRKAKKKRAGGMAQGIGPEYKPQYHTYIHKKKREREMWRMRERGKAPRIALSFRLVCLGGEW